MGNIRWSRQHTHKLPQYWYTENVVQCTWLSEALMPGAASCKNCVDGERESKQRKIIKLLFATIQHILKVMAYKALVNWTERKEKKNEQQQHTEQNENNKIQSVNVCVCVRKTHWICALDRWSNKIWIGNLFLIRAATNEISICWHRPTSTFFE